MAKRKRLSSAIFSGATDLPAPETKSMPIANVAGDAATAAALAEVTDAMQAARREGRLVLALPLDQIDPNHLVRDRTRLDAAEMATLIDSLRERGQQTPIEVSALEDGRYGLISGWRRLNALRQLDAPTVLALVRDPQDAAEAYLAMVEENEVRADLSYYERARIVVRAVEEGVFETEKKALLSLFRSASRAKRSKIKSFIDVVRGLGDLLQFPEDMGERMGLRLSKALGEDGMQDRLRAALVPPAPDAETEQSALSAALTPAREKPAGPVVRQLTPGLRCETHADGRMVLSGRALTPEVQRRLQDWLRHETDG